MWHACMFGRIHFSGLLLFSYYRIIDYLVISLLEEKKLKCTSFVEIIYLIVKGSWFGYSLHIHFVCEKYENLLVLNDVLSIIQAPLLKYDPNFVKQIYKTTQR
jgi:hypothetical protein